MLEEKEEYKASEEFSLENNEFVKHFATPTEKKSTGNPEDFSTPGNESGTNELPDDEQEPDISDDDFEEPLPGDNESDDPLDAINMSEFSDSIVELFDGVMKIGLSSAYDYTALSRDDRRALISEDVNRAKIRRDKNLSLTEYEIWLLDKDGERKMYNAETVPLSDEEKERLKKRFRPVMAKTSWKPSPEKALIITIIAILLLRVLPLIAATAERVFNRRPPRWTSEDDVEFDVKMNKPKGKEIAYEEVK